MEPKIIESIAFEVRKYHVCAALKPSGTVTVTNGHYVWVFSLDDYPRSYVWADQTPLGTADFLAPFQVRRLEKALEAAVAKAP